MPFTLLKKHLIFGCDSRIRIQVFKMAEIGDQVSELQSQMTAVQAALEGNAQSSLFKQPPFHGFPNEDVNEWLLKYERISKFYNWSNAKKLGALPLLLGGTALAWFQTLPAEIASDFKRLTDELKSRFGAQSLEFIFRQELYARKQGPNEPLSLYTEDIIKKCQRLALSENEIMNVFINGLVDEIKTHVILGQPKTFAEAESFARLRNAVKSASGVSSPLGTSQEKAAQQEKRIKELEGQVTLLMSIAAKSNEKQVSLSKPVQALDVQAKTAPKLQTNPFLPDHQSPVSPISEIQLVKSELIAAMDARFNRENPDSKRFASGAKPRFPRANQNFARGRNLRTTDGQPICNYCQRVGHVSKYCNYRMQPPAPMFQNRHQEPIQSVTNFRPSYHQQPRSQNQPQNQFGGKYESLNAPGSSQWGN